jgi:hypothetical protein
MLLGGSVLSAITLLPGAARLTRRRAQVADTWTFGAGSLLSFSAYEGGREGTCHLGICQ